MKKDKKASFICLNYILAVVIYVYITMILTSLDFEIGTHTGAKTQFLHTVYTPCYGAPSVYALVSRMAARIPYRITADTYIDRPIRTQAKNAVNLNFLLACMYLILKCVMQKFKFTIILNIVLQLVSINRSQIAIAVKNCFIM